MDICSSHLTAHKTVRLPSELSFGAYNTYRPEESYFQLEEVHEGKEVSRRWSGRDVAVMRAGAGVGILI